MTRCQLCLFKLSLTTAVARLGVSLDDVRRWHDIGWLSFDESLADGLDEFDDPRIWEIQIVRDIVRSGLTDAQIEVLFSKLPKPFSHNPDTLAYSFRHGWVVVVPPVEVPEPFEVIEEHVDAWIATRDREMLEGLREQIDDAVKMVQKYRE